MKLRPNHKWFLAFTGVFAALAAFVFWGTWSLDVVPVMPDDTTIHPVLFSDRLANFVNGFCSSLRFYPHDVMWCGVLGSQYFWQELKYAVALYCAGLGLAYFMRGRGLSPLASYGAGLLLAFCGYWASLFSAGHAGWFIWMIYGVFAFGLVDRAVRKNKLKNWLLLGACVGWAGMSQPDLWFFFTIFTAAYFVWCCVRERKLPWKGALVALAAFIVVGMPTVMGAVMAKASRENQISAGDTVQPGAAKDDADARWIFVTNWSLPPDETAEFFFPRVNGDTSCPLVLSIGRRVGSGVTPYSGAIGRPKDAKKGNYRQHCIYVGFVSCLLALAGGVMGWKRRKDATAKSDVRFFVCAAIAFWLLSLGRYCEPVYRCVFALPIGDSIRCPVKWHHLTELSLAVLAAYGIDRLLSLKFLKGKLGLMIIGAAVLIGAFDLARVDKLFCAPVDVSQVRKTNSEMQMSVLRRQDFSNPQVAAMVKSGRVVMLANYLGNPDLFLVEMLTPRKPIERKPMPPFNSTMLFGLVSLLGTVSICAYSAFRACRPAHAKGA